MKKVIENFCATLLAITLSCCVVVLSPTSSMSQSNNDASKMFEHANGLGARQSQEKRPIRKSTPETGAPKAQVQTGAKQLYNTVCNPDAKRDQSRSENEVISLESINRAFGFSSTTNNFADFVFVTSVIPGGVFHKAGVKKDDELYGMTKKHLIDDVERILKNEIKRLVFTIRNDTAKRFDQIHISGTEIKRALLGQQQQKIGTRDSETARRLAVIGETFISHGSFNEAEPFVECALEIFKQTTGKKSDYYMVLAKLLEIYSKKGPKAQAVDLANDFTEYSKREDVLPFSRSAAYSLNRLAGFYKERVQYGDAETLFNNALALFQKTQGSESKNVGFALNNLAELYREQERYVDAEPLYKRSLVILEKSAGIENPSVAALLNNLGALYDSQGRALEAEQLYKRALKIREKALGPNHPEVAETLMNLGVAYDIAGRYADAQLLFKRTLEIREKSLGSNHRDVADVLVNLADSYGSQGRYTEAESLYNRTLKIRENTLAQDHPQIAGTLNNIGSLFEKQGRHSEAEALFKRSLAIFEKAYRPDSPSVSGSLNNLALFYDAQERYADALPIIMRLIASKQAVRSIVLPILNHSETRKLIDGKRAFVNSYNVLQFTSSSEAAEAVASLVRQDQDLESESARVDKDLIGAVSKASNERNADAEEQMRERLDAIRTEREKIDTVFRQTFPDYVALAKPAPLTVEETQKLLEDDEAVVAFDIEADIGYAWVVTKDDSFWTDIPTSSKALDKQVTRLRQSLTSNGLPYDAALAHELYNQTFGPIATKLAGKKRLSIFANGALTSIPFALLVVSDPSGKSLRDTEWLIKSYAVTVIPSIFSLKTMRSLGAISTASKPMIAFGDPVFSKAARTQAQVALRNLPSLYQGSQIDIKALREMLPQLDGTRKEIQTIAKDLGVGSADIKLGLDATETSVKQSKLDQYKIVYFATHGLVSGDLAKFSKVKAEPALALTIPDTPTELDDGLLQASEISELRLNADWVVLSACNTASADSVGAEALSGLARGFLYAGAKSLVVSHWEVDDEATATLMSSLFNISKTQPMLSHAEALQRAMLKMLAESKTEGGAHPRLWAPFIVVGEPAKPLAGAPSNLEQKPVPQADSIQAPLKTPAIKPLPEFLGKEERI